MDLKQLTRLLSECNYGGCNGGVGLGDLPILFNATAKRMSAITFDGVLKICRWGTLRATQQCRNSSYSPTCRWLPAQLLWGTTTNSTPGSCTRVPCTVNSLVLVPRASCLVPRASCLVHNMNTHPAPSRCQ